MATGVGTVEGRQRTANANALRLLPQQLNTRRWMLLNEALANVIKPGLAEGDAKQDICSAIADGAIDFRVMLALEVEDIDVNELSGAKLIAAARQIIRERVEQKAKPLQ